MGKPTFSVFGSVAGWPRALARLFVGGCVMLGAVAGQASAAPPTPEKMLAYKPKQDVSVTTPSAADYSRCTVDLDKPRSGVGSSWVLKGPDGRLLRRYYSSSGGAVDLYSYYKDGIEVYREMVSPGAKAPDHFRWINAGGSKYGVDLDRDGSIDAWKVISVEEASQELMKALAAKDFARFQALTVSDADLTALGLSGDIADGIKAKRKEHKKRFETAAKLTKLGPKANWLHVETPAPDCVLAESTGAKVDLLRYSRGTVLFETGGASDWFQTGQMIKVGDAWKLIEGPVPGAAPTVDERVAGGGKSMTVDPEVQKLVEALTKLEGGGTGAAQHLSRADLLEKIIGKVKPTERDPWLRQLADSLSSAAQAEGKLDGTGLVRLVSLETQLVRAIPGQNLTAYVTFRRLQAAYSIALSSSDSKKFNEIQKDWLDKLTAFVKAYPKSEDAPDAMLPLGMVCEFLGKEVEAKNWYLALARSHPGKPQALKGEGAARRLSLEGQTMKLAAPLLMDASTPFDIDQMRGKLVVVYYWASWNGNAAEDFGKLKAILSKNKDVALLCVNLDGTPDEGKAFLKKNDAPGTHLYRPGGLDSTLAAQYGVMVLPSLFLVGKDGKVVNKGVQMGTVEDEVKKALSAKK